MCFKVSGCLTIVVLWTPDQTSLTEIFLEYLINADLHQTLWLFHLDQPPLITGTNHSWASTHKSNCTNMIQGTGGPGAGGCTYFVVVIVKSQTSEHKQEWSSIKNTRTDYVTVLFFSVLTRFEIKCGTMCVIHYMLVKTCCVFCFYFTL